MQKSALTLLAAIACTAQGATPLESSTPDQANPPLPTDEAGVVPKNAYESNPAIGVPYERLFRTTNTPYAFSSNDLRLKPTFRPTDTTKITGGMDLPDFRGRFPLLQRGFAPENADLKIGPLYFKLRQLSAGVLWSDNINHDNSRRESDFRGIASIGAQAIWQITEGSRIAASGNFVWLPFDDEAGLTGFALRSPLAFGLSSSPNARVQASWEPMIFGIPWVFADEFRTATGRYSNALNDNFELFEGFHLNDDYDEESNIRAFRGRSGLKKGDLRFDSTNGNNEFLFFSNEVSAATMAKVNGDFNFQFRAAHENLWYPDDDRGLPSERNTVSAGLQSYRESLRFKPYLRYLLNHHPDPERLYQSVRAGVQGPVTDLINFNGNFGYLWRNESNRGSWLWHAHFDHTINPRTRHSIEWSRHLVEFSDELTQSLLYQFNHILGPGLSTDIFAGYHWTEDLDGLLPDREEFRTGARINWNVSPRTTVRLSGHYGDLSYSDGSFESQLIRGRFELTHRLYDRITSRLIYQHTQLDGSGGPTSYDENLMFFSLSYLFQ